MFFYCKAHIIVNYYDRELTYDPVTHQLMSQMVGVLNLCSSVGVQRGYHIHNLLGDSIGLRFLVRQSPSIESMKMFSASEYG